MFTCDDQRVVNMFLDLISDLKESSDSSSLSILKSIVFQVRKRLGLKFLLSLIFNF